MHEEDTLQHLLDFKSTTNIHKYFFINGFLKSLFYDVSMTSISRHKQIDFSMFSQSVVCRRHI